MVRGVVTCHGSVTTHRTTPHDGLPIRHEPLRRPSGWPVAASEDLYRGDWMVALRSDSIRRPGDPDGEPFDRWVFEHPGAVDRAGGRRDERVACVRQYRHPARRTLRGAAGRPARRRRGGPAGHGASGSCVEEAELEAGEWRSCFALWPSAGHHRGAACLLPGPRAAARRPRRLRARARGGRRWRCCWVPVDELRRAVLDGRVTDEPIVVAVLAYDALRRRDSL